MNKTIRVASLLLAISATSVQTAEAQGMGPIWDWINKLSGPDFGRKWAIQFYSPVFRIGSDRVLTEKQRLAIDAVSDWLVSQKALAAKDTPLTAADTALASDLKRKIEEAQKNLPRILNETQWELLPDSIKGSVRPSSTQWSTSSLTNGLGVRFSGFYTGARTAQEAGGTIKMEKVEIKLEFPWVTRWPALELAPVFSYAHYWFFEDVDPFQHNSFSAGLQVRVRVFRSPVYLRAAGAFHFFPPFETTDFDPLVLLNDVSRTGLEVVGGYAFGVDVDLHGFCRLSRLCS